MLFLVLVAVLIFFIVVGIPVGFALGLSGIVGILTLLPFSSLLVLSQKVVKETVSSHALMTIPMFLLMAEFLGAANITRDLLLACNKVMHRVRGGMAMACVLAGTVLAAASGSSTATAATISRAIYPTMKQAGYSSSFAVGSIAISGTLAMMIPPSIAFVLYGLMTEYSIGKLFMAGILPGLLTAVGYIVVIWLTLWWRPELGPKPGREAELAATSERTQIWPIGLLITIIFTALYSGVATPTEIAAIGACGALIICLFLRRLSWFNITSSFSNALRTTAMIITIIFSAHMFGYFVSFSRITDTLLQWIDGSGFPPIGVVMLLVFMYLLLGMLMDQAAIMILTAPITAPLVVGLGYDPIWWGVIIVKTSEIGMVTPPVGLNVYVAAAACKTSLSSAFKGITPFVVMDLLILALLIAVPSLPLLLVR
tara:strand:- start:27457 stop:28734 length:1278 start_codon:yes stop_codon:yes gene_type:complete